MDTDRVGGLDVARFGDDESAFVIREGNRVVLAETWHGKDTMWTCGRVKASGVHVNVDVIGIGAGVVDRLLEQEYPCAGINLAEAASASDRFCNQRAELYWNLRERFRMGEISLAEMPSELYERLVGELTAIKYGYDSAGRIRVEDKGEIKKRIGRSTDLADALVLAFAPVPGPLIAFVV